MNRTPKRFLRWLVLPCLVFVTMVGVTFSTSAPAWAFTNPIPLEIAESALAPEEVEGTGVALGACVASVACGAVVVGGAAVAAAAYATRDTWLPIVQSLFGSDSSGNGSTNGAGCAWTGALTGPNAANVAQMGIHQSWSGCGSSNILNKSSETWACRDTTTGAVTTGSASGTTFGSFSPASGSSDTFTVARCSGSQVFTSYSVFITTAGGVTVNSAISWTRAIPAANYSQTSTMQCKKPDGTTGTFSATYLGHPDRILVPSCDAWFPGSIPMQLSLTGGWPGNEQQIGSQNFLDTHTSYPGCFGADGSYLGTCRVRVYIGTIACHFGVDHCYHWHSYYLDHEEADVHCQWGQYRVRMRSCYPSLQTAYRTDNQTTTVTDPCQTGDGPDCVPTPDPGDPTPSPSTPPDSTLGTGTNPDPGDDTGRSCIASAFSFNPINWVYVPVKCVLRWAFEPDVTSLTTDMQSIATAYHSTDLYAWQAAVAGALPSFSAGGCSGPHVNFSAVGAHWSGDPLSACAPPLSAAATASTALITIAVCWFGALACVRALGSGFGWNTDVGKGSS